MERSTFIRNVASQIPNASLVQIDKYPFNQNETSVEFDTTEEASQYLQFQSFMQKNSVYIDWLNVFVLDVTKLVQAALSFNVPIDYQEYMSWKDYIPSLDDWEDFEIKKVVVSQKEKTLTLRHQKFTNKEKILGCVILAS